MTAGTETSTTTNYLGWRTPLQARVGQIACDLDDLVSELSFAQVKARIEDRLDSELSKAIETQVEAAFSYGDQLREPIVRAVVKRHGDVWLAGLAVQIAEELEGWCCRLSEARGSAVAENRLIDHVVSTRLSSFEFRFGCIRVRLLEAVKAVVV